MSSDVIAEIDAATLFAQREADTSIVLVDVREPWEHKLGVIAGAQLLPLSGLPQVLDAFTVPKQAQLVTYCHHGMRSLKAASWLLRAGYKNVRSLAGGIDAWAQHIDPALRRY